MANNTFEVDVQDLEYQRQGNTPWLARVYQPKGDGPFPAIVDVHGGAWNNGDRTNNESIDRAFAERGIVVAALDFRQPPEAAYPASIADLNLGVRWLKSRAGDFHSTTKVGAFGNSSGGHQVVLAGLRPKDPRYAALPLANHPEIDASLAYVIAAWPVIDPLYRYKFVGQANNNESLMKSHLAYFGSEEGMAEGSPQTIVEEDEDFEMPPIFVTLKVNDSNHPLPMQEAFIAGYKKRGGDIQMEMFDGLPERRMAPGPDQPESTRAIDMMAEFIHRHSK